MNLFAGELSELRRGFFSARPESSPLLITRRIAGGGCYQLRNLGVKDDASFFGGEEKKAAGDKTGLHASTPVKYGPGMKGEGSRDNSSSGDDGMLEF